jgi:glutamate 5-kinase
MTPEDSTGKDRKMVLAFPGIRRIVVKLGSGTVADPEEGLNESTIRALAAQISQCWSEAGVASIVVTSGAVAAGRKKLGMQERPRTVALKQAAAAVGQTTLMRAYERAFEKHGRHVAQLLLTHEDFESRERYVNAQNTLSTLLARGIVPIINENDTVATQEIRLGDNDHLATLVTQMVGADMLILLTVSDGLFTKDPSRYPDARRIPVVKNLDDDSIRAAVGKHTSSLGVGGMASKVLAASVLSSSGIPVVIASGLSRRPVLDALEGKDAGTLILPRNKGKLSTRKMWILYARHAHGTVLVDDGARTVLMKGGKSLLPAGVTGVQGNFVRGEVVSIADPQGAVFARGIARWSMEQVERGKGMRSDRIRRILGPGMSAEVVHCDDLTILPAGKSSEPGKGCA